MAINYCEVAGDPRAVDDVAIKDRICPHAGLTRCRKHNQMLAEDKMGYRTCCPKCHEPFFVKLTRKERHHD